MKHIFSALILYTLVSAKANAQFAYLNPLPNSSFINPQTTLAIKNGDLMDESSLQKKEFIDIIGSVSGKHLYTARLSDDGKTIVVHPKTIFTYGETVSVTIHSDQLKKKSGRYVQGTSYSFKIREAFTEEQEQLYIEDVHKLNMDALGYEGSEQSATRDDSLPTFTITANTPNAAPGQIFLRNRNSFKEKDTNCFPTIIENDGTVVWSRDEGTGGFDFEINRNGYLTYFNDHADPFWVMLDSNYVPIDSFQAGNGYELYTNAHDCEMETDGHIFLLVYDKQTVNMTQYGGQPNAIVTGMKIQELDASKDVIWEWSGWDHFNITDAVSTVSLTGLNVDYIHPNSISRDYDGNLIVSCRHLDEVCKINHENGSFVWRLNGENNQFTFVNDNIPAHFSYQHDARRASNGNLTLFNNGQYLNPQRSSAKEYQIDEVNKIATLVWYYEHADENGFPVYGPAMGSTQRLPNGNTLIDWGTANSSADHTTCTEVDSNNNIVWEGKYDEYGQCTYRARKYIWQPCALVNPDHILVTKITDTTAKVKWAPVKDAISYDVQYRKLGTTGWKVKHGNLLSKKLSKLKPGKTYEYQVRANCVNGYSSDWSPISTFTTLPLRLIQDKEPIFTFDLYPNPANALLFLDVEASQPEVINFSIYNVEGKMSFSSQQTITGDETLKFDVSALPSGIYFAQIRMEDKMETLKFVKE